MLTLFLSGEKLSHMPCCLDFYPRSFSYTSRDVIIFMWEISLARPMLTFYVGSFSYTSRVGFFFFFLNWGVCLTHPVLASF